MTMAVRETGELSQKTVPRLNLPATEGKRNGAPTFGSLWPHYPHHQHHIFHHGAAGKDLVVSILNPAEPEKWEARDQGLKHGSAATTKGALGGKEYAPGPMRSFLSQALTLPGV